MVWAIFAILAAFFDASYFATVKKLTKNVNQYVLASGVFLSSFLILFLISAIRGIPEIGSAFYSSVLVTGTLNVLAAALYYRALKITDLSLSIPMISFTPIFLIFTSFILLKEIPTFLGGVGIFLIVVGSYLLNLSKNKRRLLDPFRNILRNKGISYMLIVALLWSISVNFDKLVVLNSDPLFGSAMVWLLVGLSFLAVSFFRKYEVKLIYRENFPKFFLAGSILALISITVNIAYTMNIVSYTISLKRLSILFSVLFGGLIFKEKSFLKRSLAALVMLAGTILILAF